MPQAPDTTAYLYLGLAVVAVILMVFVASLVIRFRNLQQDAKIMAELDEQP